MVTNLSFDTELTVNQIVQREILSCSTELSVLEAAKLMCLHKTSSIIVYRDDVAVGIWTESDCSKINYASKQEMNRPIGELMSAPVETVLCTLSLHRLILLFHRRRFRHFLVVNETGTPIGVVSQSDVIRAQGVKQFLNKRKVIDCYDSSTPEVNQRSDINHVAAIMARDRRASVIIRHGDSGKCDLVTERCLLNLLASGEATNLLAQAYSVCPRLVLKEDTPLEIANHYLRENKINHLMVSDDKGQIIGVLSMQHIIDDIELAFVEALKSKVVEKSTALSESKRNLYFAERIIESSLDGIMITDCEGKIISVNPAFTSVTGYLEEEVIGQRASILSSGKHDKVFYAAMWHEIKKNGVWRGEVWNKRKNGDIYPQQLTIVEISESQSDMTVYAAIISDITERKHAEEKIQRLAFHDELTKLPKRALFNDRLKVALSMAHRNQHRAAVIFVDLDLFKEINDSFGHDTGDQLLVAVASRLQSCVKEGDAVARFGGDEFIVLLAEIDDHNMIQGVCQRILKALRKPYTLGGKELHVTCSMGIAVYPDDGKEARELLRKADMAMYRAKDTGKNSYRMVDPAMNARSLERSVSQSHLLSAIHNQEFRLVYQPIFDFSNKKTVAIEALIRWHNKKLGSVSPAQFIPLAEELGLITDIDRWVLQTACQHRKDWLDRGVTCGRVAVNISPLHFSQGNLVEAVESALEKSQLPASLLEIELTEGCFVGHIDNANRILSSLRELGVQIALDDFGTGFSALSYLTQLPINKLKIDASFVANLPGSERENKVINTIIAMAHSLDLSLVAEGVETQAQLDYLQQHLCHTIQGFLLAKPMPADRVVKEVDQLVHF